MADGQVDDEAGEGVWAGKEGASDTEEDGRERASLLRKHKAERRELQGKIQNLKRGIAKGDRKKKKEIYEQIACLEAELEKRQELELACLTRNSHLETSIVNGIDDMTISNHDNQQNSVITKPSRISKAQKRRDKKADKEREREQRIAEQEIENLQGARFLEYKALKSLLAERNLVIHEVPSDGNCLYMAVKHQLQQQSKDTSLSEMRRMTANHMREHSQDFRPFLTDSASLELFSDEQFEKYCNEIENTPAWGGHLELQALSCALEHPIEIVQADGPPIVLGEQLSKECLLLTYHRHAYSLGAHYNSVVPADSNDSNAEW